MNDLRQFLLKLWSEEVHPRPDNEAWPDLIRRIGTPGKNQAIVPTTYWYFLEILPPHYQWGSFFAFAEGREPLRLFARTGEHFACRQLTWEETLTFCSLAGIRPPQ